MDERLHKVHEMINRGIDEIAAKPVLDKETLCLVGELVDVKKDLAEIEAMEDYGYSEMVDPMYYNNGSSYARGRGNRGRGGNSSYGYGRAYYNNYDSGYSRMGEKEKMIKHLERAMENASNEHEREKIHRMIMQLEED